MNRVQPARREAVQRDRGGGQLVEVRCSFCGGKGKDPFGIMSWLSTCCVCGGRGVVQAPAAHLPCAHCRGTGAVKTFTCTVCRGTGYVPRVSGPQKCCPECRGTGAEASSALPCLACGGRGCVPLERAG